MPPGHTTRPDCVAPDEGARLVDYLLRRLPEPESEAFEAHMLTCERCFEDYVSLERSAQILGDYVEAPGAEPAFLPPAAPNAVLVRRWHVVVFALACLAFGALAVLLLR